MEKFNGPDPKGKNAMPGQPKSWNPPNNTRNWGELRKSIEKANFEPTMRAKFLQKLENSYEAQKYYPFKSTPDQIL